MSDQMIRLSGKRGFQMSTGNCQWWCGCRLFWQGVPDMGTSNCEDHATDSWQHDRWYQQATTLPTLQWTATISCQQL